jgi:carboxyl-terminal processing protease
MTAEVFAASLRDLSGASVIGGTTKGDVSLTKTFSLGRGRKGLTLTVARLFPPSGEDLEEKGLEPGLKIALSSGREEELKAAWAASSETALLTDPSYKKALDAFLFPQLSIN